MREMTHPVADVLPGAGDLLVRNVNPTASSGHVDLNTWRGGAPAFPNTGTVDEGVFSAVDGTLATFMDAAAVPGAEATPTLPEPVEVALANVPLPYDVDATQHI